MFQFILYKKRHLEIKLDTEKDFMVININKKCSQGYVDKEMVFKVYYQYYSY